MSPEEIRALRQRLGLTQWDFAERLGTTVTTIHRWEVGIRHPTGLYKTALLKLAAEAAGPASTAQ